MNVNTVHRYHRNKCEKKCINLAKPPRDGNNIKFEKFGEVAWH